MTLWQALIEEGLLSPLDCAFAAAWGAQELNTVDDETSADYALLLIYMLRASLEGHLCAIVPKEKEGRLFPDPLIWLAPAKGDWAITHKNLFERWRKAIELPTAVCPIAKSRNASAEKKWPLIWEKGRLYLQRNLLLEDALLASFAKLMSSQASVSLCPHALKEHVDALVKGKELLSEQGRAIESLSDNRQLSCIAGGPGTGKTHTARHLIDTLIQLTGPDPLRIALAAPTGRASANLQRGMHFSKAQKERNFAGTLHALLGITGLIANAHHNECNPLPYDAIVVDESSMIDAPMMLALLQAMKPGARLIMMGDPHQLPPVEIGGVFFDLTAHLERSAPSQVTYLQRCMRTEIQPILTLCEAVRRSDVMKAFAQIDQSDLITWHSIKTKEDWRRARHDIILRCLKSSEHQTSHQARCDFERLKVLTPLKVGIWGTDSLNQEIYQMAIRQPRKLQFAPLMVTSNHRDLMLFNGDQGVVHLKIGSNFDAKFEPHWRESADTAHFAPYGLDGQKERIFPSVLLTDCELAWCSSIHKAQGSEYDEILLIIPPGAERMYRELLYTALTRTRARLTIWADESDFKRAIERSGRRLSGLQSRFCQGV